MRRAIVVVSAIAALAPTGCGGTDTPGTDHFQFETTGPDHWVQVWCKVNGSMTRDDALKLMGVPTQEFDGSSGGEPQSSWDAGTFSYTVFYDSSGNVRQAYVKPLELRGQPKPFDCPLKRVF